MHKQVAVALLLQLAACNYPTTASADKQARITADSGRASHCFAAHNFWVSLAIKRKDDQARFPGSPQEERDTGVRALWELHRFGPSARQQGENEQVRLLTEQMLKEPESAAALARECRRLEDHDPAFHRARNRLLTELLTIPQPLAARVL
jgi:hypothetical protein